MERTRRPVHPWQDKIILKIKEDREPREIKEEGFSEDYYRKEIEPWLTALFQSEHLSLLAGAGLSSATHLLATGKPGVGMTGMEFSDFKKQIELKAKESAKNSGRITENIEDQIRIANELIRGLEIFTCVKDEDDETEDDSESAPTSSRKNTDFEAIDIKRATLASELANGIKAFAKNILDSERNIVCTPDNKAVETLMSFLMSFASRSATRVENPVKLST